MPLAINITLVEVAVITAGFFFMGQADNASQAQQHAAQLCTAGAASNAAVTADLAAVLQSWLSSAVRSYVGQMELALDASAGIVAAVDVVELGLFSTVVQADVAVLNATIDWDFTAAFNVNITQNYAYNVTVQAAVLTSDLLLSVFVDVLSSSTSRRRLQSEAHHLPYDKMLRSMDSPASMQTKPVHAVATAQIPRDLATFSVTTQQQSSNGTARVAALGTAWDGLHGKARSLHSTEFSSAFPLSSLLAFKTDLMLAAFADTSGCSIDSLTDLFFEDSEEPEELSDLCVGVSGSADLSLNEALFASARNSVPLLQVLCCAVAPSGVHVCLTVALNCDRHEWTVLVLLHSCMPRSSLQYAIPAQM